MGARDGTYPSLERIRAEFEGSLETSLARRAERRKKQSLYPVAVMLTALWVIFIGAVVLAVTYF